MIASVKNMFKLIDVLFVFLVLHINGINAAAISSESPPSKQLDEAYFTGENNTEILSQAGSTVVLHCPVENIGDNVVSWIRRRDFHVLTVGQFVYTSDDRFKLVKGDNKDWQLHIRFAHKSDEGEYECQVTTHPPISLISRIVIFDAVSEILGSPEKFIIAGSSLRLVCKMKRVLQQPTYVFWYFNDQMVNYDVNLKIKIENSENISVLFLENLRPESSGNYSCVPSNARSSHIQIHVLKDYLKVRNIQRPFIPEDLR